MVTTIEFLSKDTFALNIKTKDIIAMEITDEKIQNRNLMKQID